MHLQMCVWKPPPHKNTFSFSYDATMSHYNIYEDTLWILNKHTTRHTYVCTLPEEGKLVVGVPGGPGEEGT